MNRLTRETIVSAARGWVGTPYRHQASLNAIGCDCLGLVRGVWRDVIGPEPESVPAYSPDWAEACGEDRLMAAALRWFSPLDNEDFSAGDILLYRWREGLPAKHVGIATSATTMIHAHDGACVCEVTISLSWRRRLVRAFAFPGL